VSPSRLCRCTVLTKDYALVRLLKAEAAYVPTFLTNHTAGSSRMLKLIKVHNLHRRY
jgi:hypothetical protein